MRKMGVKNGTATQFLHDGIFFIFFFCDFTHRFNVSFIITWGKKDFQIKKKTGGEMCPHHLLLVPL